jgi:hypothetical protein
MSRDPQKMKLLAEVQRLAGENIELEAERDTLRKAYDLSNATNSRLVAQLDELEATIGALSVYVPRAVWGESVLPCLARAPAQSVAHIEAAAVARAVLVLAADRLKKGIVDLPRAEIEAALLRTIADDWGKAGPYGDHARWARGLADRIEQAAKS